MDKQTILSVSDLSLQLKGVPVFNNLAVEFKKGESVLIAGRNGAGKSTLLKCLAGVMLPDAGDIAFEGGLDRRNIGLLPENLSLFQDFTLQEGIDFHRRVFGIETFDSTLLDHLNLNRKRKIKDLSAGERVLYHLSLLISQKPALMLVDEVIHAIDPYLRELALETLIDLLEDQETTVVMVNQVFAEIEQIPERVLLLEEGAFVLDHTREELSAKMKKVTSTEAIPPELPVVFTKNASVYNEYYIYPFEETFEQTYDLQFLEIDLNETIKAFLGGYYAKNRD